jgi:hypothetical protein
MTNKNPYEIRLDVLKMAQDMLEAEQRSKELKFKEQVEVLRSMKGHEDDILNFINNNAPSSYTPEEVIARSSALYGFVSSSNAKKDGS